MLIAILNKQVTKEYGRSLTGLVVVCSKFLINF